MDGFTITSNKGVQIPVGVKIDGASLTRVANELRVFTETLQKKCNLKLTIDTSAAQNVISQIQTSMNLLQSASNIGAGGRSGRGGRSGGSSTSHQDREINRIVERYTNVIDIAQRKLAQGFSVPGAQEAVDNLQRLLEQYRATGEGANALRVAASTLNAALSKEASIEKYSDVIDVAQRKLNQGFKIPTVQEAINNLRQLLEHYRATGEGANALKVASEQLSAALRNEAAAAKRVNSQTNTRRTENKSAEKQFDVSKLNAYNNALERMRLRLLDIGPGKTTKEFEEFRTALGEVAANGGKGFDTLSQKAIQAQHSIKALAEETSAAKTITSKYTDDWFAQQGTRLTNLSNGNNSSIIVSAQARLGELAKLKSEFTGTASQIETFNAKLREYEQLVARAGSERTLNRSLDDQATSIANLKSQYQAYMTQFGQNLQHNLPLMEKFKKFGEDLSAGGPSNELQRRWAELTAEAKRAGVEVQTVRQRMTHLFSQHFNTALIMLAIRGLRQALRQLWQDIKEVNEALVQTQIVTGLTGAALEAYTDKAYAAADKSKDKVTNILSEATAFGRLGYDSELSVQLAQLTSMYSKLGNVDTSDATDAITALMKAFNLENADEIELALDKMIYVGNNFPISAAGLGEGLNNAASALSSAGNSLEQTLALLMAANATVQNPSKSSTAMRTITARIRNTKAELDELGEELDEQYNTVAKYREQLKGLTGVDILDAAGKEFRSTYDILSDLAGMWENLDSTTQAAVTTMLAGTKQQDIFASLMKNFPSAQEAMAGMGDAAGLMDEKFNAVEDSISGALSGLSNAWSKFSNTLLNSEDVVSAVRALTSLVNVLERLTKVTGGGGMIAGALAITSFIVKMREFNKIWPQMQNTIATIRTINVNGAGGISALTDALSGYNRAQQEAILKGAGYTASMRAATMEQVNMEMASRGLTVSNSLLGASIDGLKAKLSAFVASGNIWVTLIMLAAQIGAIIDNASKNHQRLVEETRQAEIDLIRSSRSTLREIENNTQSVEGYRQSITELQEKLESYVVGSDDYKNAQIDLYKVEKDIVDVFGEQSGAVRGATESLGQYVDRLDEVAKKSAYLSLLSPDNLAGTNAALKLFGVNSAGDILPPGDSSAKISTNNILVTYKYDHNWERGFSRQDAWEDFLNRVFGSDGSPMGDAWWHNQFNTTAATYYTANPRLVNHSYMQEDLHVTGLDIETTGKSVSEIVDLLEAQVDYWLNQGDINAANIVSETLSQYKEQTGYNDAMETYDAWLDGFLRYESKAAPNYTRYRSLLEGAEAALLTGDAEKASLLFHQAGEELQAAIDNADNDFVRTELYKFLTGDMKLKTDFTDGILKVSRESLRALIDAFSADGAVNIGSRPTVSSDAMKNAGWNDFPNDSYATLYSSTYSNEDGTVYMNFTPILPDGSVLTPDALEQYALNVVNGVSEDTLGLKVGGSYRSVDDAVNAAIFAHILSEAWEDDNGSGLSIIAIKELFENGFPISTDIIKKMSTYESRIDAVNDGLGFMYDIFSLLSMTSSQYETELNNVISLLSTWFKSSPDGTSGSGRMFASDTAKPSNYDDKYKFTEQGTATSSTSKVGALDKDVEGFLKARTAFFDLFGGTTSIPDRRNPAISGSVYRGTSGAQPGLHSILSGEREDDDAWSLDVDKAKDAIDLINEYFGTSFDEITEENFDQIVEMFEAAGVDIYGAVEGNLEDVLQFVKDKADEYGIDMGDIIDIDNGTINFDALNAALASIPESADKAGASASAYLANELQRVAGMTFSLYDAGDGVIKVKASGGRLTNASTTTDSKKGGGGGGGKHSQISDDIENVERLIKLFKELLNYYDEGSEQWIARQRQIIDQYKAGVEIAMAEYNRLIKKGLKQTDDDVKKIVDTILDYQGDIFDESEKLWDAVRKNQIDSLKHLKDQNDAAIELEKTHHDLLIAIRDERRELEDELKAARDAYSEVMTPEELDAMFSVEDYAELMDKLASIEGDAMALYRDYKEQIAAVSEDETYMIEHITDEFKRQYDLKMKEYEIAKAELGVARAQQELENVKNEQTVMMLIGGRWQWVADPEKVLEAEQKLADAEQELADAQDEYDFQSLIHEMEAQSSAYQKQIDALEALTFSMDELAEQIHLFSDSVYKELLTYLSQIAQATFDKYAGDTAVPAFSEGGVIKRGGLAMVHSGEPIFSTADAERLWRFVHGLGDTPINVDGVIGSFAQKLVSSSPIENQTAHQTVIDNSINIPGGIHVNGETAQQLIALLKSVVAPYQP